MICSETTYGAAPIKLAKNILNNWLSIDKRNLIADPGYLLCRFYACSMHVSCRYRVGFMSVSCTFHVGSMSVPCASSRIGLHIGAATGPRERHKSDKENRDDQKQKKSFAVKCK